MTTFTTDELGLCGDEAQSQLLAAAVEARKTKQPVTVKFGLLTLTIAVDDEARHDA